MSRRQPEHGTGDPLRTGRHRSPGSHATTTIEVQSRSLAARGGPQHFLNFFPLPQGPGCIASHLAAAEAERTASAPRAISASGKTFEGFTDEERAAMKERAQELKATARPAQ